MVVAEAINPESSRQGARIPYFKTVGKEADFHRGVAVVIAMSYGVDNRFSNSVGRATKARSPNAVIVHDRFLSVS
jgi:hypothetical protein